MPKPKSKPKKTVQFKAKKIIPKKTKVKFQTKKGSVSFWTTKKVPKKVDVKFLAKSKPKKIDNRSVKKLLK